MDSEGERGGKGLLLRLCTLYFPVNQATENSSSRVKFNSEDSPTTLFCIKKRPYFVHTRKPTVLGSPPHQQSKQVFVYLYAPGSYANSNSQLEISLSLALMDLFLICCEHRALLLKREKKKIAAPAQRLAQKSRACLATSLFAPSPAWA
jgi:hypothetical protein